MSYTPNVKLYSSKFTLTMPVRKTLFLAVNQNDLLFSTLSALYGL